jgi:1-deoxy-D-xylulose 5-phosphate reductoisomerase
MKIAVLGSTGSIGLQTLDVCRRLSPRQEIAVLSARSNGDALMAQAIEFGAKYAVLSEREAWEQAKSASKDTTVLLGDEGLEEALSATTPDITVNAIWGAAGLKASLSAIRHSRRLALANKESLVSAGELVMGEAKERGCEVVPIDSEQSAIFQALQSGKRSEVRRVMLTASGGPFLNCITDMRVPIQYALTYPDRARLDLKLLDLCELGQLTFRKPDGKRFQALALAWEVLELGGTAGAALVSANQRATAAFLEGMIGFNQISEIADRVLQTLQVVKKPVLEDIFAAYEWGKAEADRCIMQGF